MNSLTTIDNSNLDILKNIYFRVGANFYALPLKNVVEVMKLPKLDYPQKLPSNFVGVLKYNNIVLNVLDIRIYLGIEVVPYSTLNKLIIVKTDETIFGIIVDEIKDIVDIETSKIGSVPFYAENQIIDAVYNSENESENVSVINAYALEKIIKNGYPDKNIDIKTLFPIDETSLDIFQKRAVVLAERFDLAVTKNVFSDNKFLSFFLNNIIYCINLKYVKEVTNLVNMISLPCSPEYIEGLMTLKGDFITILNVKKFFGFSKVEYSQNTKVIVVDSDEFKLGLLVDEINDILDIPEEKLSNKDLKPEDIYFESEVIDENGLKYVLDMEKILSDKKLHIEDI